MLRTRLDLANDRQISPLLVTSAVAREGKSVVAANLALSMARAGHNVALVDLDARQPTVATRFSLGAAPGLTSIVAGKVALEDAIVQYDVSEGIPRRLAGDEATMSGFRLIVLPLGPPPNQPGEFVHSGAVAALLANLQRRTDCVIIDSPPILGASDALVLGRLAGAVLFVTRPDRVTRQILHETHGALESMAAVVLGIVINAVDRRDDPYRPVYPPTRASGGGGRPAVSVSRVPGFSRAATQRRRPTRGTTATETSFVGAGVRHEVASESDRGAAGRVAVCEGPDASTVSVNARGSGVDRVRVDGRAPRVLHVTMRLDSGGGGIASATVANLIAERRHGIDSTVVFATAASEQDGLRPTLLALRSEGVAVHCFPRVARPAAAAAQFGISRTAFGWLSGHIGEFDLVHVQGPWGAICAWALIEARRRGVATMVTAHESLTLHDRLTSQSWLRAAAKRIASHLLPLVVDHVIFTSEAERDTSRANGRHGNSLVWHAVIDDRGAPPPVAARGTNGEVIVGVLSRLDDKKNIPVVLDAVARTAALRLRIAGVGSVEVESELRRRAEELGLRERAVFLGYIPRSHIAEFFASIDVLAMPSNFENFGLAAAEALAHGVPAVVSEHTGVAGLIRSAKVGAVVPIDATELAEALLEYGNLGQDPAFAREVQNVAVRMLSFTAHAQRIASVYATVLRSNGEGV